MVFWGYYHLYPQSISGAPTKLKTKEIMCPKIIPVHFVSQYPVICSYLLKTAGKLMKPACTVVTVHEEGKRCFHLLRRTISWAAVQIAWYVFCWWWGGNIKADAMKMRQKTNKLNSWLVVIKCVSFWKSSWESFFMLGSLSSQRQQQQQAAPPGGVSPSSAAAAIGEQPC